jgi:DNA-binding LacI/PurR family transcriptional regulator
MALNHLARLGHTRIAFAGNPMLGDIQERQGAYEDYVASNGLASHSKYIQHVPNSFEGGVAAFEALLQLRDPPTAVAAATDVLAIGMLHCAYEHGLDVPADFSIVGFDDIPFAAMTTPPLSTVRMPVKKMVRAAVTMVIDRRARAAAAGANDVRIFRPSLVVRGSSGKLGR